MQLEAIMDKNTARILNRAGLNTQAELQRAIVGHGLVRRNHGGWQFGEGGPRLRNCGPTRWGILLDALKKRGFAWERYVKNIAPIQALSKEPPAPVTQMIPAQGWRAVYATEQFDQLLYATLIAWARVGGEVVALVVNKSGHVVAANHNPYFLGYIEERAPDLEDFMERMARLKELFNG